MLRFQKYDNHLTGVRSSTKYMNYSYLIKRSKDLRSLCVGRNAHISWIMSGRKVLGLGFNNCWKTDALAFRFKYRFCSIHSELAAIKSFVRPASYLRFCVLVNVRFLRDGTPSMSRPCSSCQYLLQYFGLREVYYTTNEGVLEKCVL